MPVNIIRFNTTLGQQKPENIVHAENPCPFCDRKGLRDIIATEDDFIFLRNKYNVIDDAELFVLVECRDCGTDMPDYSRKYMRRLIRFGVRQWKAIIDTGRFRSVLFFKNHGPLSGGTMRHAHMQIVGLNNIDNDTLLGPEDFYGIDIDSRNGVTINAATRPRLGFSEFNILADNSDNLDEIADYIQLSLKYFRQYVPKAKDNYNIFFYQQSGKIRVKVMPRFPTSPLFVGYDLRILPYSIEDAVPRMKKMCQEIL